MYVLINPDEDNRIVEKASTPFPVADPLYWKEMPDPTKDIKEIELDDKGELKIKPPKVDTEVNKTHEDRVYEALLALEAQGRISKVTK